MHTSLAPADTCGAIQHVQGLICGYTSAIPCPATYLLPHERSQLIIGMTHTRVHGRNTVLSTIADHMRAAA